MSTIAYIVPPDMLPVFVGFFMGLLAWGTYWAVKVLYINRKTET